MRTCAHTRTHTYARLQVSIEADGSACIRAVPTASPAPHSSLSGRDADEAAAAMRELSELTTDPPPGVCAHVCVCVRECD